MKISKKFALILSLTLLALGCSGSRFWSEGTRIRVLTYNIHHGEGPDGKVDIERIANVIKDSKADIVALQEVDRGVERTKKIDIMTMLADLTGMTYAFGKNTDYQGGDYGNGVLTKYPILEERNLHYKMIRTGEQRGLMQLVLEVQGNEIAFMNTHIDYRQDDSERVMNVKELRTTAKTYAPRPVIVCGDFNDLAQSRTIALMKEEFADSWEAAGKESGSTYPAEKPTKRIDFVFVSKSNSKNDAPSVGLKPSSARVIDSDASDHRPLLVEFQLTSGN